MKTNFFSVLFFTVAIGGPLFSEPAFSRGGAGHASHTSYSGSHSGTHTGSHKGRIKGARAQRVGHSHVRSGFSTSHRSSLAKMRYARPNVQADHLVSGYYRRDGNFVKPYHATNADHTRNNNYSTKGNTNPYTGQSGTKPRDGQ